jgi:prepilin-type N-terminal cleavage/methylation domain-containing protein
MNPLSAKAFTLLEMLLVIAIITVLAALLIFTLRPATLLTDTKEAKRVADQGLIEQSLEAYAAFNDNGEVYPPGLTGLADGVYDICTEGATNCSPNSVNIDELVEAGNLLDVPVNPECGGANDTCYNIVVSNGGDDINVASDNDLVNLLLNKPIVYSQGQVVYLNYHIIYTVVNINDGNTGTIWRQQTDYPYAESERAIAVVDMQDTKTIRRLEYHVNWDNLPAFNDGVTVRFSISPNNTDWTTIHEKRLTPALYNVVQNNTIPEATGRYVKFEYLTDGNWSGWGNVIEISAYSR